MTQPPATGEPDTPDRTPHGGAADENQTAAAAAPAPAGERPAGAGGRRRAGRVLVFAAVIVLLAAGATFYYLRGFSPGIRESLNVLVIGLAPGDAPAKGAADGKEPVPRLGAAAVVSVDPRNGAVTVIAVPGQTRFGVGDDAATLREIYAAGGRGPVGRALEVLLGAPLQNYAEVRFAGFAQLVDALGGIELVVDEEILYRSGSGEVLYRLSPGRHRLDGPAALLYVRYQGDAIGQEEPRLDRHRRFGEAMARAVRTPETLRRLPQLVQIVRANVDTDLGAEPLLRLARFALRRGGVVELAVLPGQTIEGQYVTDGAATGELAARTFYNPSWAAAERP